MNSRRIRMVALAAALALWGGLGRASAATRIWDGSVNGNWTTAANWAGNVAPVAGDFLVFPGAVARLVHTNNYAANTVFGGITISGDNYNIYGNGITLTNHLTLADGANGNVFRPAIRLGATLAIRSQGTGPQLILMGGIDLNGRLLTFDRRGEVECTAVISGTGNISHAGLGRTVYSGTAANTYSGTTIVWGGILELAKYVIINPGNLRSGRVSVPGNLVIGTEASSLISDAVVCEAGGQIADAALVAVNATGELNLNGYVDTIESLTIAGGDVHTEAGRLTVATEVRCHPDANGSTLRGRFGLGVTGTVFFVNLGAVLRVSAEISGGPAASLTKLGLGELHLLAANAYEGRTVLQAGSLALYDLHALGIGSEAMNVEGGTLTLVDTTISARPMVVRSAATLASSGANSTWRGEVNLEQTLTIRTPANSTLSFTAGVSGPGGLEKSGSGTCRFTGLLENTFTGAFAVQEGTLELNKSLNQQNVVSIPGGLIIGDGDATPGSAVVRHGGLGAVADTSQVTVNRDGVWDLNGWEDEVGGLTLAGGSVQTLAGTLTLGGDVQVNASASTASIGGHLDLGNAPRTFTVADGAALYDLDVSASISGGPGSSLVKEGPGVMRLVGDAPNTYSGPTVVNAGMLRLWKLPGLVAVPGDLVIGNSTGGLNTAIVTAHLNESIANTAAVTIHESGQLNLNGFNDSIGPLILTGPGNVTTGVGILTLGGDVTVNAATAAAIIAGNLSLGGATRAFHVANSLDFYDLRIPARISGSAGPGPGWTKDGEGVLLLSGANIFTGPAQVMAGGLYLEHSDALGAASAGTTLGDGTFLTLGLNVSVGTEPLSLGDNTSVRFLSANNAWAGNVFLNGHTLFSSVNLTPTEQLNLSGAISGPGSLALAGGQLLLSGNTPNTYGGTTTVFRHTLVLSKNLNRTAVPGALVIGNGSTAGAVELAADDQIADAASVSVASQAVLDLKSYHEKIGPLEGTGGVALGSGTLTVGGSNPNTTFSGTISGTGALIKTGTATLTLSGANTYAGLTLISNSALRVSSGGALGSGGHVTLHGGRLVLVNSSINGKTLNVQRSTIIGSALLGAEGPSSAWNGDMMLQGPQMETPVFVDAATGSTLILNGAISGTGELRKTGPGLLRLSGTSPNTYLGDTEVEEGTVELAKQNAVAVAGRFRIGPLSSAPIVVRYSGPDQVADNASMSVGSSSRVQLSQWTDRIGFLSGTGEFDLGTGTLTVGWNSGPFFYSGAFTGSGHLIKAGTNRVTLTGTSTHTGNTVVSEGMLVVNGQLNPAGGVQVANGATLSGTGVVGNVVAPLGGRVAPGTSPGQLTASSLLLSGGDLDIELNGAVSGTGYDRLMAGGAVTLSGTLKPSLGMGFTPAQGDTFVILDKTSPGTIAGTFDGLSQGALFDLGGLLFQISYFGGNGNDVTLTRVAPPQSQLTSPTALPDGSLQISGQGWPGLLYTLEATDSLEPPVEWTVIATDVADENGVYSFTDLGALLHPMRFYRVLEP